MERNCGNCLVWKQNGGFCPIFQEKLSETEQGCPKFTGEIIPCDVCGQPIVGKFEIVCNGLGTENETWHKICKQCASQWGMCPTCHAITLCDFETNPINIPKQVQQQIRQGNMVVQTVVRNPEREKETCVKNCECWNAELGVCWRQYCMQQGCIDNWRANINA